MRIVLSLLLIVEKVLLALMHNLGMHVNRNLRFFSMLKILLALVVTVPLKNFLSSIAIITTDTFWKASFANVLTVYLIFNPVINPINIY